jgi:HAD superfamily phosphatase (TIGR01668 family)
MWENGIRSRGAGWLLKNFLPDAHVESVFQIQPEKLKEKGIKGIITDLDNTLVAWNKADMTPELLQWFNHLRDAGLSVMILSNNSKKRVRKFTGTSEVPYIFRALKPAGYGFRRAMREMGLKKDELVVVGDQIVTDIYGGNRLGMHTMLVVPIDRNDAPATKLNRMIERFLLSRMRRRGWMKWED